jgi:RNA polymerase sigma factor (sigma-70 family)
LFKVSLADGARDHRDDVHPVMQATLDRRLALPTAFSGDPFEGTVPRRVEREGNNDLAEGLRAGKEWAIRAIQDRYQPLLVSTAIRYRLPEPDRPDYVQDVLYKVARAGARFRGDDQALSSFLRQAVKNAALDHFRARKRLKRRFEVNSEPDQDFSVPGDARTPEQALLGRELVEVLDRLVADEPELAPHLKDYLSGERSQMEIAAQVGSRKRFRRALERIKTALARYVQGEDVP